MGGFVTALVFNINVIMGSGALAIPYAFYISGYALGSVTLCLFAFLSYITISYNFEAQMRLYVLAVAHAQGRIRFQGMSRGADHELKYESYDGYGSGGGASPDVNTSPNSASKPPLPQHDDASSPHAAPLSNPDATSAGSSALFPTPLQAPGYGASKTSSDDAESAKLVVDAAVDDEEGDDRQQQAPLTVMDKFLEATNAANKRTLSLLSAPVLEPNYDVSVDQTHPITPANVAFDQFDMQDFWEINDVLLIFGGRLAVWGWNACNVIFQLAVLWTFMVVLASTSTLGLPIPGITAGKKSCNANNADFGERSECMTAIRIWFFFFSATMLALVVRDWKFMATLQRVFAALVYVCLAIIMITCIVAMTQHDFPGAKVQDPTRPHDYVQQMPVWNMSGFAGLFGICVFALLCHSATTFILKQMPSPDQVKPVFRAAFGGILLIYGALGLIVSFYIGNRVEKVATLDWSIYREWGDNGWLGSVIGNIVLFFPVLSITPGFVLRLRSLTDAVEAMIGTAPRQWFSKKVLMETYRRSGRGNVYRFQLMLRVFAVLIALCCSLVSYHFHRAIEVTSFAGFTILFLFPVISQYGSRRSLERVGIPHTTPFDDQLSSKGVLAMLAFLGLASFVYYSLANFVLDVKPIHTGLGMSNASTTT